MIEKEKHHTALITGANSGVGFALTKRLLHEGWYVIALIRSDFDSSEQTIARARHEGRLRVYRADLSDFADLKRVVDAILTHEERIDVLFNNAAAAVGGIHFSPQGREMHYEVNTVVPYIILMELKPLLAQGVLKTVINTSSNALLFVKKFNQQVLEHPTVYKAITGPYGSSKLALSLWTQALAPALQAEGIELRSVNPGANKTKMTNSDHFPKWMVPIRNIFFSEPSVGAARLYDAAFGHWRGTTGVFIHRDKATPLPFVQQSEGILHTINALYEEAFLAHEQRALVS